ncbi:formylglycine-generating enzyme family protein [Planctomycetota bacterium]
MTELVRARPDAQQLHRLHTEYEAAKERVGKWDQFFAADSIYRLMGGAPMDRSSQAYALEQLAASKAAKKQALSALLEGFASDTVIQELVAQIVAVSGEKSRDGQKQSRPPGSSQQPAPMEDITTREAAAPKQLRLRLQSALQGKRTDEAVALLRRLLPVMSSTPQVPDLREQVDALVVEELGSLIQAKQRFEAESLLAALRPSHPAADRLRGEVASLPQPRQHMELDLGGGVKMALVFVPSGAFLMGSRDAFITQRPVHRVRLDRPFYIGVTEVTQAQWEAVMSLNPSKDKGATRPVENVSWHDCQKFCQRLTRSLRASGGLRKGAAVALPSEAEWEYACRAGSETRYHYGDSPEQLGMYAWSSSSARHLPRSKQKANEVAQLKPNAWGLYDMHGNVSEWCEDVWHVSYEGAPVDGSAWTYGGDQRRRVLRSAPYWMSDMLMGSAQRMSWLADSGNRDAGLRCVVRAY